MGRWVQDGAVSLHHDGNTDIWGWGEVPVAPQRVKKYLQNEGDRCKARNKMFSDIFLIARSIVTKFKQLDREAGNQAGRVGISLACYMPLK